MCGLTAIFAYGGAAPPVDGDELTRICAAMINRGPDDHGHWTAPDRRVALGHRRLSIIDPSPSGHQPMCLLNGDDAVRLAITYNGEIYNYKELRAELVASGRSLKTDSDTEAILHLYDRDGPSFLSRLRGMFALAIWDVAKQGIFLARDPFGIKPLYIADDGATVRVASQVKALQAGKALNLTPEPAAHVGFHLFGHVPEPFTMWREIVALPAGCSQWIDAKGVGKPNPYFSIEAAWHQGEETAAQRRPDDLREALLESVRHHLIADVPVGVFLSGGIDSTVITGLAAETTSAPIRTVTLAFDEFTGTDRDEAPLAAEVAQLYGTDHHCRRLTGAEFRDSYQAVLTAMDQPSIDGVNSYFVAAATAATGLKVALSGVGGDELFGGYDTFRQVPALVRGLGWIPGLAAFGRGFRAVSAGAIGRMTSAKYAGLLEYSGSYGAAYLLRRGLYMPWELPNILDPDMVREGWRRLDPIIRLDAAAAAFASPRGRVAAMETAWYLRGQLLRDADWAGMAHSLEIRTPLVDAHLFGTVAGWQASKQDLAATPARRLPAAILNRPKTGFFVPVREWLDAEDEANSGARGLRGWARKVYRDAPVALAGQG